MDNGELIVTLIRFGIPTVLLVFLIVYTIIGVTLSFHWRRYAFNDKATALFIGSYIFIGIAVFAAGGIGAVLLIS